MVQNTASIGGSGYGQQGQGQGQGQGSGGGGGHSPAYLASVYFHNLSVAELYMCMYGDALAHVRAGLRGAAVTMVPGDPIRLQVCT